MEEKQHNRAGFNPSNPLQMEWVVQWIGELGQYASTISVFQSEYDGE